jgi:putative transposase
MPIPKAAVIKLSEAEQHGLEKLVNRHTVGQQIALRGRIVLAAGAGQTNRQISQELGVSMETVRVWRGRWLEFQPLAESDLSWAERLQDLPRSGAPAKFTADQICQVVAIACEKPTESGRPISQWSGREIADELIQRGIVESISARHAARFLKIG